MSTINRCDPTVQSCPEDRSLPEDGMCERPDRLARLERLRDQLESQSSQGLVDPDMAIQEVERLDREIQTERSREPGDRATSGFSREHPQQQLKQLCKGSGATIQTIQDRKSRLALLERSLVTQKENGSSDPDLVESSLERVRQRTRDLQGAEDSLKLLCNGVNRNP